MVDINKIVGNLKETSKKVYKSFDNITNYLTMFDYIKDAKNIALIGHDNIDGDSLGSTLAMQQWLKNKFPDKKIKAYTSSKPGAIFDFLEAEINYQPDLILEEDIDLIITFDAANLERLGDLYENNKDKFKKTSIINIDHHISNTKFGTINIVDIKPATAQVLYNIINFLENKLNNIVNQTKVGFDKKVATYLLMGILTDTQMFMIPTADENTLLIAADLIKKGADKNYLVENLFQNKTLGELKLEGLIFDRIKIISKNDIKFAYSYYTMEDLERLGLDVKDSALGKGLASKMIVLKGVDFTCLARIKDTETSLSFRSKYYDVNQLAGKFAGGGHKHASGAKITQSIKPDDIEKMILEKL